jgi:hypothetical protein
LKQADPVLPVLSPTDETISPTTIGPMKTEQDSRSVGDKYKLPYDDTERIPTRSNKEKGKLRADQEFDEEPEAEPEEPSRASVEIDELSEFLQDTQLSSVMQSLDATAEKQLQEVIAIFKSL